MYCTYTVIAAELLEHVQAMATLCVMQALLCYAL